jgi:hypothetical protein
MICAVGMYVHISMKVLHDICASVHVSSTEYRSYLLVNCMQA